jgi:hypothetical protein
MEERHACHSFLGGIAGKRIGDLNLISIVLGALVFEFACGLRVNLQRLEERNATRRWNRKINPHWALATRGAANKI